MYGSKRIWLHYASHVYIVSLIKKNTQTAITREQPGVFLCAWSDVKLVSVNICVAPSTDSKAMLARHHFYTWDLFLTHTRLSTSVSHHKQWNSGMTSEKQAVSQATESASNNQQPVHSTPSDARTL